MSIGPGAICRRRIATGSCSPMNSPRCRSMQVTMPAEVKRALKRKEEPSYQGTFTGAKRYVLQTFANTQSALMKKRVAQYHGEHRMPALPRQTAAAASALGQIRRAGYRRNIPAAAEALGATACPFFGEGNAGRKEDAEHPEKAIVVERIAQDLRRGFQCCSISGWAISAWSAARRRCRRENCSGCGSRRKSAPICSASSMCSTSLQRVFTRPTPKRCCGRSIG